MMCPVMSVNTAGVSSFVVYQTLYTLRVAVLLLIVQFILADAVSFFMLCF